MQLEIIILSDASKKEKDKYRMISYTWNLKCDTDFSGGAVDKHPSANAGHMGLIPGLGRSHVTGSSKANVPQLLKPKHLEPVL